MFTRIRQMMIKEFLQVLRDPRMRTVIFVIPCVQMLVIGYAVTIDVRDVRTAVFDEDNSQASRELVARFVGSGYFKVVERVDSDARVRELMDHGEVTAVLHFHHGFENDLRAGRKASVQFLLEGTDSNTAAIAMSYASRITAAYSREISLKQFERTVGRVPRRGQPDLRTRAWFNDTLESRNYFVPGVIAIVVSLVTLQLTAMSIVREKEVGTMEQLLVTPITPAEFILGKTLPFAIIGMIDVLIVSAVGVFWFEVPIHGSLLVLLSGTALYLLTMLGTGLFISTISRTQQQALMSIFLFFFPVMLLSGFAFPVENMPPAVQWLTIVNPLKYFLVIVRSVFLRGVGIDVLWPEMLALALIGVTTLFLAIRRVHKTL